MRLGNVFSLAVAGLMLACTSSSASAQSHPLGESLGKLDKDGDGKVSKAEWTGDKAGLFKKIDTNSNGQVTLEEVITFYLKAAPANDPKTQNRIDAVMTTDGNDDYKVTRDELVAAALTDFKARDTDGDGFLTLSDKR